MGDVSHTTTTTTNYNTVTGRSRISSSSSSVYQLLLLLVLPIIIIATTTTTTTTFANAASNIAVTSSPYVKSDITIFDAADNFVMEVQIDQLPTIISPHPAPHIVSLTRYTIGAIANSYTTTILISGLASLEGAAFYPPLHFTLDAPTFTTGGILNISGHLPPGSKILVSNAVTSGSSTMTAAHFIQFHKLSVTGGDSELKIDGFDCNIDVSGTQCISLVDVELHEGSSLTITRVNSIFSDKGDSTIICTGLIANASTVTITENTHANTKYVAGVGVSALFYLPMGNRFYLINGSIMHFTYNTMTSTFDSSSIAILHIFAKQYVQINSQLFITDNEVSLTPTTYSSFQGIFSIFLYAQSTPSQVIDSEIIIQRNTFSNGILVQLASNSEKTESVLIDVSNNVINAATVSPWEATTTQININFGGPDYISADGTGIVVNVVDNKMTGVGAASVGITANIEGGNTPTSTNIIMNLLRNFLLADNENGNLMDVYATISTSLQGTLLVASNMSITDNTLRSDYASIQWSLRSYASETGFINSNVTVDKNTITGTDHVFKGATGIIGGIVGAIADNSHLVASNNIIKNALYGIRFTVNVQGYPINYHSSIDIINNRVYIATQASPYEIIVFESQYGNALLLHDHSSLTISQNHVIRLKAPDADAYSYMSVPPITVKSKAIITHFYSYLIDDNVITAELQHGVGNTISAISIEMGSGGVGTRGSRLDTTSDPQYLLEDYNDFESAHIIATRDLGNDYPTSASGVHVPPPTSDVYNRVPNANLNLLNFSFISVSRNVINFTVFTNAVSKGSLGKILGIDAAHAAVVSLGSTANYNDNKITLTVVHASSPAEDRAIGISLPNSLFIGAESIFNTKRNIIDIATPMAAVGIEGMVEREVVAPVKSKYRPMKPQKVSSPLPSTTTSVVDGTGGLQLPPYEDWIGGNEDGSDNVLLTVGIKAAFHLDDNIVTLFGYMGTSGVLLRPLSLTVASQATVSIINNNIGTSKRIGTVWDFLLDLSAPPPTLPTFILSDHKMGGQFLGPAPPLLGGGGGDLYAEWSEIEWFASGITVGCQEHNAVRGGAVTALMKSTFHIDANIIASPKSANATHLKGFETGLSYCGVMWVRDGSTISLASNTIALIHTMIPSPGNIIVIPPTTKSLAIRVQDDQDVDWGSGGGGGPILVLEKKERNMITQETNDPTDANNDLCGVYDALSYVSETSSFKIAQNTIRSQLATSRLFDEDEGKNGGYRFMINIAFSNYLLLSSFSSLLVENNQMHNLGGGFAESFSMKSGKAVSACFNSIFAISGNTYIAAPLSSDITLQKTFRTFLMRLSSCTYGFGSSLQITNNIISYQQHGAGYRGLEASDGMWISTQSFTVCHDSHIVISKNNVALGDVSWAQTGILAVIELKGSESSSSSSILVEDNIISMGCRTCVAVGVIFYPGADINVVSVSNNIVSLRDYHFAAVVMASPTMDMSNDILCGGALCVDIRDEKLDFVKTGNSHRDFSAQAAKPSTSWGLVIESNIITAHQQQALPSITTYIQSTSYIRISSNKIRSLFNVVPHTGINIEGRGVNALTESVLDISGNSITINNAASAIRFTPVAVSSSNGATATYTIPPPTLPLPLTTSSLLATTM